MNIEQYIAKLDTAKDGPISWLGHYIEGQWQLNFQDSETRHSENPNTGEVLLEPRISRDAVMAAIELALHSKNKVQQMGMVARLAELNKFANALADYSDAFVKMLKLECGRPDWEAHSDVTSSIRYLQMIVKNSEQIKESLLAPASVGKPKSEYKLLPVGVALGYLPFSTPLTTFCTYFSAAILSGCPLVLVSTTHSSGLATLLGLLADKINLSPELLGLTFCSFKKMQNVFKDRKIDAIMYTGSREQCDSIRKESHSISGRQLMLQSGGKNAMLVHSSANIDLSVKYAAYGAYKAAGQLCTSTSRIFVYKNHLQEFCDKFVALTKTLKIGDTLESKDIFMGPLYSKKAVDKFLRFQTMAQREESECLIRGKTLADVGAGYFITPSIHLMDGFNATSSYQSNVLFCPDVAVYSYDVLEDAIGQINQTDAAFAVSFMGESKYLDNTYHLFAAPNILVNQPTCEIQASLPLAGRLQSGHHRFCGPGLAMRLSYPQVIQESQEEQKMLGTWPLK